MDVSTSRRDCLQGLRRVGRGGGRAYDGSVPNILKPVRRRPIPISRGPPLVRRRAMPLSSITTSNNHHMYLTCIIPSPIQPWLLFPHTTSWRGGRQPRPWPKRSIEISAPPSNLVSSSATRRPSTSNTIKDSPKGTARARECVRDQLAASGPSIWLSSCHRAVK